MNIIIRANPRKFDKEDKDMCEALMELMADEILEIKHLAEQQGLERGQRIEREHIIEKYITSNLEENCCKEKIIENLYKVFDLNTEQAEEYFEKYACVTE